MSTEELITVQEAAGRIGWPVMKLRAYCTAKRIPCEMDPETFDWLVKASHCVQLKCQTELRNAVHTEGLTTCRL